MRTCGHLLSSTLSFLTLHTERAFRTTGLFSGVRISLAPSVPRSLPQSSLETPAHSHILLAHLPLSHYSVYEPPRLYTLANCWPTLLLLVWAPLVIDTHTFHNYFFPLAPFFCLRGILLTLPRLHHAVSLVLFMMLGMKSPLFRSL